MFASPALFGRCTRVFVAFDPTQKEVCVMKDSWRVDNPDIRPEHKVYERLKSHQVEDYILTCLGGENVGEALARSPQRTRPYDVAGGWNDSDQPSSSGSAGSSLQTDSAIDDRTSRDPHPKSFVRYPRVHYRIFFKEVCRPLTDFHNWFELVVFLIHALRGE